MQVLGGVFWGSPELKFQVIPDYRVVARLAQQEGKQEEATLAVRASQNRARSWLAKDKSGSWRLKKRYRSASHGWAVSLDNQLRQGTGMNGLDAFQVQAPSSKRDPEAMCLVLGLLSELLQDLNG